MVTEYFNKVRPDSPYLDKLGFQTTGYGCMTCIGNSGPLPEPISTAVDSGRSRRLQRSCPAIAISTAESIRSVKANYLASPPLVVAFALAGTMDINIMDEPIAKNDKGRKGLSPRHLAEPEGSVTTPSPNACRPTSSKKQYGNVANGNEQWNEIPVKGGELFDWDDSSTYIQEPPFFEDITGAPAAIKSIDNARVLVMVGDSVTTDHISPAGAIKKSGPAGAFLQAHGVSPIDFNSYGSRRGNDRVMTRGTFANIRLKNQLAPGTEGGVTTYLPTGEVMSIYDASVKYIASKVPLAVLAGKDYGMGSSRDWAAKGVYLLGVKFVIAESFERIHRSNLVGMGVLPLVYKRGETRASLGLTGQETFTVVVGPDLSPLQDVVVNAVSPKGKATQFVTTCRIDTPIEIEYYRNGGILQTVLRNMLKG